MNSCFTRFAFYLFFSGCAAGVFAQTPEWIWFNKTQDAEARFFRKTFTVDAVPNKAELIATADDGLDLFFNGDLVISAGDWTTGYKADVTAKVKPGRNVLAIRGRNGDSSPAGVVAQLTMTTDAAKRLVVTDPSWKASEKEVKDWTQGGFNDSAWASASSLGKMGTDPWGQVFGSAVPASGRPASQERRIATSTEDLYVLPGFKVELLHSGEPEEGSWVNLCKDDRGRLIISPQYRAQNSEAGLLRVTLGPDGAVAKREWIARSLYDAQGMVFSKGVLWVVVNKYSTKFESGLYRITDDGSDTYGNIEQVMKFSGGGEHGPHAVEVGPDGNLWVLAGNHTKVPEGVVPTSPLRDFAEDHVLPRQWDGNGHAAGVMAPGGYILRGNSDGSQFELHSAGFRNHYDFAFNADGELFTYDADMEWDWGMPWYRPTRVNHCVSGGEYGWRSGTGKWPDYYPDSLGAIDIGVGCPTGVASGRGAKFPAKYQRAIYILDWTYGRLMAVHLTPDGASYVGSYENFLCPAGLMDKTKSTKPFNITDAIIGNDGSMYCTIGGRGTASGLYRVSYVGNESTAAANEPNRAGAQARALRRQLEAFHGRVNPAAADFAWPHLNSPDRAIRFAARVALEAQPVASWKDRALAETWTDGGLTALLALARVGGKSVQDDCLRALGKWPLATLPERQRLDKLRVIQVSLARNGYPSESVAQLAVEKLSRSYPNQSEKVNRELSQVLIALGAPDVVGKTLELMASARTQEDLMHYLFHLRTAKNWTLAQREAYFNFYKRDRSADKHPAEVIRWFQEAGRPYGDGASFQNFLKNFFNEAVANLNEAERTGLEPLLASVIPGQLTVQKGDQFPKPAPRSFVKDWTMEELAGELNKVGRGRNFERGRQAFVDAQCLACHRFANQGGGVGPDLTALYSRFGRQDVLEAIIEPSKVVSEQFQNTTLILKNGDDVSGRLVDETADALTLVPNQLEPDRRVKVNKGDVAERRFSKVSPMPEGLASTLSKEELLDLLAFLESGGRRNHGAFRP